MTTFTSKKADLETVASDLDNRGIFARFVKVDNLYHSRFMNPLKDELPQFRENKPKGASTPQLLRLSSQEPI